MWDKFLSQYRITSRLNHVADGAGAAVPPTLSELFARFSGTTFGDGLYRIHTPESAAASNDFCARLIRGFAGRMYCFGFDWLGRNLAVDLWGGDGEGLVVLVEPGAGELLESEVELTPFHDEVLVADPTGLAAGFFDEWRSANPGFDRLAFDQCVGYKVPLFLGGDDEVHNLEVVPYDVYWELCVQLRTGTRHMPAGTTIQRIIVADDVEH